MVAQDRRQPRGREREGVLQHEDQLAQRMDATPLRDAIDGSHDLAVERREDGRSPGVALPGRDAREQRARPAGRVVVLPAAPIGAQEVERVALASRSVPWLGTRSAGELTATQPSPRSGNATTTGGADSLITGSW